MPQSQKHANSVKQFKNALKPPVVNEPVVISKSMKKIFNQLEFNMANNEIPDGGAINQEDLDRKQRLIRIM